ncbi:T9SS type A sorting domain-containing protein [Flavobacterium helocola]|uniref:T9SS type A sorting domain-containing protein n=1 Tax=Flavobacterium helocola TaxID=3139139 RepID=A0ABU9I8B6_9FLAO
MINNYDSVETCLLKGSANSKKQESTSFTGKKGTLVSFMTVFLMLFSFVFVQGQTTLISPTGDGGFENGATFAANGWTTVNPATDTWQVGNVPVSSNGVNCAYVSANGGAAWTYSQFSVFNHVYRDVTIPAGENKVTLTFKWKAGGEGSTTFDWDNMKVFWSPTTFTPTSTTAVTGATQLIGPGAVSGMYKLSSANWNTETIVFSATPGTYRLIFQWKSDGLDIANPPAALDEISLTSQAPGNFISIADGNWSNPATWDANAVPTGLDNVTVAAHTVTIDAVGQAANNLTIQGSLEFGATPGTFNVNGNLTLEAGAEFLVFNGTTGKAIVVSGNIVNDGNIDLSIGATTTGSLTLNGSAVQSISGAGTFANEVIRNLIFSNTATATPNVIWGFNNIKIANNLNITGARINLNGNKIYFGNNAAGGTFTAPVGTGFINGSFSRWWTTAATGTAITAGTDPTGTASRYPFITSDGSSRALYITRPGAVATGNTAGYLTAVFNDVAGFTTGLSIADGAYTITDRTNGNWQVSEESGYVYVSGTHTLVGFYSGGILVNTNTAARLMNPNSVVGTFQNGSTTPAAQRTGITTTQLTAEPFHIGVNSDDIPFVSVNSGDWSVGTTWDRGTIPTCTDFVTIANGHTVTSTTSGNVARNVTIATGGTLVVSAGDLTVGCTLNNNTLANSGTLTVSGGLLAVNGNMLHNAASIFNQSGGDILVDGNEGGVAANSVASGVAIVQLNSQFINWTGGALTILDPHANATASNTLAYNNSTAHVNVPNTHTLRLGDGVSTDAGGNATNGFRLDTFVGSNRILFGNLEVNTLGGTNRQVTTAWTLGFSGNMTIQPSSQVLFGSSYVAGNIVNNGTFTSTTLLGLSNFLNGVVSATTNAQTIGGTGVYRNLAATPTANLTSLTVNNTNATGVTLNAPISVSGTLTMTSGIINTTDTNLLTLGTATAAGTLAGTPSATNMVRGPFARTIGNANANTNYILFPVGKTTYAPIWSAPATTAVSVMKAETFDTNTGTQSAAIANMATNRRWELPLVSGTITDINVRVGDAGILATSIPVQAPSAAGEYTSTFGSVATAVAGVSTQSTTPVLSASYTGYLSYADSNACVGAPTPGNTIASSPTVCLGESITLSLQNLTTGSGVTYQWQSSPDGVTYTNIGGANNAIYTVSPTAVTYYQCIVTCATGPSSATSTPVQITFTNNILTTTPASRCGTGTVNLNATANAGATINWYANPSGGSALASGASFTSPSISSNTTYYVASETTGGNLFGGKLTPETSWTGSTFTDWGIVFTALQTTTLNSVDVYSTAVGTLDVKVTNAAGVELYATGNINVAAGGVTTPTVIPLNFNMVQGTTYKILVKASAGVSLVRGSTNLAFPYNNGAVNVTSSEWGGTTTSNYYYFYNLTTTSTCSSPRVPVVATVSSPPALTLSGTTTTICSGATTSAVTLTAGALDYNTFVWSPATGVTGDETIGWTFNPTITTAYTLTATQTSGALCATTATYTVNVNPLPTNVIITPAAPSICINNVQSLAVTGGTVGIVGKVGAGTSTNTTSTPFRGWYGGSKTQALYTPAELTALGVEAGQSIRSIGYVALSGTPIVLNNFTINAGFVSNTTLGAAFIPGATNVVLAPTNYTPAATGNIDFTLSTPLTWDGVSSLLIETCFNNNNGGGASANSISVESTVVAAGLNLYRSEDSTVDVCTNATAPTAATTRPNLRISTLETANVTWSPVTNLFTDAGATIPYTGTNATTVYVQSATPSTTVYTATATIGATGCFTSNTVSVTVSALADTTITRVDDTLTAAEAGATYQWYTCAAGPVYTPIGGATSQSYTATAIGSYAVDVTLNGCTSRSTCFDVTTLGSSSFDMNALTVYPNPVVDILSIRYNEEITAINVYDLSGRLVKQITPNQTEVEVNMSELAAAMYIVKVNAGGNQTEIKVIKK